MKVYISKNYFVPSGYYLFTKLSKKLKKKFVIALSNPQYHVVMDHAMFYVVHC